MNPPVSHHVHGQQLWLSSHRAIFWEAAATLIVSDLHFGKTGHFRKSGIPIPQSVYKEDLQRLVDLLLYFKPKQLVVVGDFFHSEANLELEWFRKWRDEFSQLKITLVKGNHDILHDNWYLESGIELAGNELITPPFHFIHDQCEDKQGSYTFCGHVHPGVVINGAGRQSLRFPCFYFTEHHCILPAFSKFTGAVAMDTSAADAVFAIVQQSIIRVQ